MGKTLTTRVSNELDKEIEKISEEEKMAKSAEVRRLLEKALEEYKIKKALEKYKKGKISLEKAAEEADISIRELLTEMKKRKIHFSYSKESLKEDIEAA